MFSWRQLQEENKTWADHNFPDRKSYMPLLGMTEEMGELIESEQMRRDQFVVHAIDACADIMVFMSDYCNQSGIELQDTAFLPPRINGVFVNLEINKPENIEKALAWCLGRLSHIHLKGDQNIKYSPEELVKLKMELCGAINFCVDTYLEHLTDRSLLQVTEEVWSKVRQRDWVKDRKNAGREKIEGDIKSI